MNERTYTYTSDPSIALWAESVIGPDAFGLHKQPHLSLAILSEDRQPLAAFIYHNWDRRSGICEISGAAQPGRSWATRKALNYIFEYPFEACQMVVLKYRLDNPVRQQYLRFCGQEYIIRRAYGPKTDGALHTITREEWHAHPIRYKEQQAKAA